MKHEIKEILDRLERIDHKEYSGGFEFADSASFDEMARCFEERKKMANCITNLQNAIEYIENELFKGKDDLEWCRKNDGCISGSDLPADAILPLYDILKR